MRKCRVQNIVFSSSCATYGIPTKMPVAEDEPQVPINPYGKSKLMIETILKDYSGAGGMNYVSLR